MASKNTGRKITEALEWQNSRILFPMDNRVENGKTVFYNGLEVAINNGEYKRLLEECAEELYDGDMVECLRHFRKLLSSQKITISRGNPSSYSYQIDLMRWNMLDTYTKTLVTEAKGVTKHMWEYSYEEIQAIPLTDLKLLESIYNCMSSKSSRYPEVVAKDPQWYNKFNLVSTRFSNAKRLAASGETPEVVDPDAIIAKITARKFNELTTAELDYLAKSRKA